MNAQNHKPTKRRNIKRWMENRLRRIDGKLDISDTDENAAWRSAYNDVTPLSMERCRDRGSQLANALQIMICDELRAKRRAAA